MKYLAIILALALAAPAHADTPAETCKTESRAGFMWYTNQFMTRMDKSCHIFFDDEQPHTVCWKDSKDVTTRTTRRDVTCH